MTEKEKWLLLELILFDIRANWSSDLEYRLHVAEDLANELQSLSHVDSIAEYKQNCEEGFPDGRFFRLDWRDGGYEGMESIHKLTYTLSDKSEEFQAQVSEVITYPEHMLS